MLRYGTNGEEKLKDCWLTKIDLEIAINVHMCVRVPTYSVNYESSLSS